MQSQPYIFTRRWLLASGLLLLSLLTACDLPVAKKSITRVSVSGQLTLDGEPIAGAKVVFLPRKLFVDQAVPHPAAAGVTDDQGRFQLKTDGAEGASPGDYLVLVSKRDDQTAIEELELPAAEIARKLIEKKGSVSSEPWMSEESIPSYYNWKSKLRFTVPANGTNQADFQLSIFERPLDRDTHSEK